MAATASNSMAVMLALGGYQDTFNVIDELANAGGFSFVEVSGGSTVLSASQFAMVLDGSAVTLPASPSTNEMVIVIAASPSGPTTVSPGASDTINGGSGGVEIGERATLFKYSGTTWLTS